MANFKFTAEVDLTCPTQVQAMQNFISALSGFAPVSTTTTKSHETPPAETQTKATTPPKENSEATPETELSADDVRAVLARKVKSTTNRPLIKAELGKLGATKIPNLDPSKYQAFVDFLNTLEDSADD